MEENKLIAKSKNFSEVKTPKEQVDKAKKIIDEYFKKGVK